MSQDRPLNWRAEGRPNGPAVVLIHGLCESLRAWDRLVPLLADRLRIVRLDLYGFGDSPSPPAGYSMPAQAQGVAEALEAADVQAAMLVGHSLGGSVAVALAERQPTLARTIALVNSPPSVESRMLSLAERALRAPVIGEQAWKLLGDRERRIGLGSAFAPGAEVPAVFIEDLARTSHAAYCESGAALEAYLAARPLADRVAGLGIPTQVIFGLQDQRVDPASLIPFDTIANVSVERLPGSGHSPMWEQPQLVADLLGSDPLAS